MQRATVYFATWDDGLFIVDACDGEVATKHLFAGRMVRGLTTNLENDDRSVLAIVRESSGFAIYSVTESGNLVQIAKSEDELSCLLTTNGDVIAGSDTARLYRVCDGELIEIESFQQTSDRESWFAGSAVIDGQVVGPPLGVRTLAVNADESSLLANVHVGGIPISHDSGETWAPTIDIHADVHEVCSHQTQPNNLFAAAAVGLCVSSDGGKSWTIETDGLDTTYCSAITLLGDEILLAASESHFAQAGKIYRRPINSRSPNNSRSALTVVASLPQLEGICDTGCLDSSDQIVAVGDKGGNLFLSIDAAKTWQKLGVFASPSCLQVMGGR